MSNVTKPKAKSNSDAVPTLSNVNIGEQDWIPSESSVKYVVVRSGNRVSDRDYLSENDPAALAERKFWQSIVTKYPDGTKVSIVQYNKKIHRVY